MYTTKNLTKNSEAISEKRQKTVLLAEALSSLLIVCFAVNTIKKVSDVPAVNVLKGPLREKFKCLEL